jgi:hypothetical protein
MQRRSLDVAALNHMIRPGGLMLAEDFMKQAAGSGLHLMF